eukprot:TRINITY_DN2480_c0_g1_i1.p1 TRINITY_DN2480_c0_g1~~TRINITY_DN2480_c0_g1_i1.p1  ORF type:complete len:100 (+),score=28.14 TRINITY_DN2480_c0_g1_i1:45-302(+)
MSHYNETLCWKAKAIFFKCMTSHASAQEYIDQGYITGCQEYKKDLEEHCDSNWLRMFSYYDMTSEKRRQQIEAHKKSLALQTIKE